MPRAAVCRTAGQPLEVIEVELHPPGPGEVTVRMEAAAFCASDISAGKGSLNVPLPIVLGHEGVGYVSAVGHDVSDLTPGDRVVISAAPQCGDCARCRRGQTMLCERGENVLKTGGLLDGTPRFSTLSGEPIHQMSGAGTFADEVVVSAISAVRIGRGIPAPAASVIGCGVLTGLGAARWTADIKAGDTVVVLGSGTVGLSALQGARLAGAGMLIATDLVEAKLDVAKALGATYVVNAAQEDVIDAMKKLTGRRRADVVIDAIGSPATIEQAMRIVGKGGEVVFVGMSSPTARLEVPLFTGLVGPAKTVRGCLFGSANNQRDVPDYVDAYQAGALHLDELISGSIQLDDINAGIAEMASNGAMTVVVEFPDTTRAPR